MKVELDDLLDKDQVAEMLGLSRNTINHYLARKDWVEPIRVFGTTPVYHRRDVARWFLTRKVRQGGLGKPRPARRKTEAP